MAEQAPVTSKRKEVAQRFGLTNVEPAAYACRQVGLPFWAACALLEKESGGANVWGHDHGGTFAGCPLPVTEDAFKVFRWLVLVKGEVSNGVGPCQITYAGSRLAKPNAQGRRRDGGFFRVMEERELRPWVPLDNMLFGFQLLADHQRQATTWAGAGTRYNGSPSYGADLVVKLNAWRKRLEIKGPAVH